MILKKINSIIYDRKFVIGQPEAVLARPGQLT